MKNVERVISQEHINYLLSELKKAQMETSIIHMKPNDISKIEDVVLKQKEMHRFYLVQEFYVKPLQRLLMMIGKQSGKYLSSFEEADNLSIAERVSKLRDSLVKQGITTEQLLQMVPKTVEEIDGLVAAQKNDFVYEAEEEKGFKM